MLGIDAFRAIAIFLIVLVHFWPFRAELFNGTRTQFFSEVFVCWIRFPIPFFFIVSGYFIGKRQSFKPQSLWPVAWKTTKRVMVPFFVWSMIYLLVPGLLKALFKGSPGEVGLYAVPKLIWMAEHPVHFVLEGLQPLFWFLPAVAIGLFLLVALVEFRVPTAWIYGIAGIIFVLGAMGATYSQTPFGYQVGYDTKAGPFFSTLFLFIGFRLGMRPSFEPKVLHGVLLMCLGSLIQEAEDFSLYYLYGDQIGSHDMLFGSVPLGIGTFMVTVSSKTLNGARWLSRLGLYTMGIYVAHGVVSVPFRAIGERVGNGLVWVCLFPFLVYGATLLLVWFLMKFKYTKDLVL